MSETVAEPAEPLSIATRIGRRLAGQASWQGRLCTWEVSIPDRESGDRRRSVTRRAGAPVYQGTAGIAFFLVELYRVTGDDSFARAALGALRHALAAGAELSSASFGFHSGRVGIAWVAARLSRVLELPDLGREALALLEPLSGHEAADRGLDVIGGAAGAIPALLALARQLEAEAPFEMARRLGERLIAASHREPGGWSWGTIGGSAVRNLAGLAHGAAGIALALLELGRATGDGRYRFAAEMAFLYERQFFAAEESNWPDLRNSEISDYTYYGRTAELRQAVEVGALPPYRLKYMTAWCHGAPGIGLSRLRAYELTGQDLYRREARAALRSTLESLSDEALAAGNYSLCHGHAGNCELVLEAASAFGDPELRQVCERVAVYGAETWERAGRPWPCGTVSGRSDPSLLLGEAGIGLFYLRLAAPETPSILLLRPLQGSVPPEDRAGFEEMAQAAAAEWFGTSLAVCERLAPPPPALPPAGAEPLARSPVEVVSEALGHRVAAAAAGPRAEELADALGPERARYQLTRELTDFTREYLAGLVRPGWEEIDPRRCRFRLAEGSRLVTTGWDWEAWLEAGNGAPPPEREVIYLLHRRNNRIHRQRVGPLAAVALAALERPASLAEVIASVAETVGAEAIGREDLETKVLPQLEELYRAGFVDMLRAPNQNQPRTEETR